MRRRTFLETLLATGTTAWIAGTSSPLDAATLLQTPSTTPPPPSPEIKRVLIPPYCGVLSALGMVVAPPVVDVAHTVVHLGTQLTDADIEKMVKKMIADLESKCAAKLRS